MTDEALRVNGVSKRFRVGPRSLDALDAVSISVGHGEVVSLLGNNGAGKSTLMSICAGLVPADEGEVYVEGVRVSSGARAGSPKLGLAPQEEALYPTLSTRKNLAYFGRLAGLRGKELTERVARVASDLMITDQLDVQAGKMSGGQRRRLHTAIALMHDPSVVLLDEPTVGVDVDARNKLLEFVRRLAESGAAVLYSTHQLHEVERLGGRLVILDRGRVLASGTVEEVVSQNSMVAAELVFDSRELEVLEWPDVEEVARMDGNGVRVVLGVDSESVRIGDVVDKLSDSDRGRLVSATILSASLEQAYLRLTRGAGSAVQATESGSIEGSDR
jgi:ABC-2 type transport system ATP-binding protein